MLVYRQRLKWLLFKTERKHSTLARSNELAMLFQNVDANLPLERDLLYHCRAENNHDAKRTERIYILDPNLEPLVDPIFF